jgi:hypothetical protein
MNKAKQLVAEIIGDGKLFDEGRSESEIPERRPGPFAHDPSRKPATKEQRERDYIPEKAETGEAAKRQPTGLRDHKPKG